MDLSATAKLNNGVEIPWVGLGVFKSEPGRETHDAVRAAIELGYRHVDTAAFYENEESVASGIRASGVEADEVFVTTKVWNTDHGRERTLQAFDRSRRLLQQDVIDLYLIHWPMKGQFIETWKTLEELYAAGKVRAIGVSNFGRRDLTDALAWGEITSNQLAYNLLARMIEHEIQPLCAEHHVSILAYSPLMQGLLTGKFRQAADVPADRARTRHFASTWPQARHGEAGCEAETFEAIDRVRAIADELGQPMSAVALAWCLHQPAVASVLAGARSAAQVRANLAGASLALDDATLAALDEATAPVKQRLGPVADLWAGQPRMR